MAVYARSIDATADDQITLSTGSLGVFGPGTLAAIIKITDLVNVKAFLSAGTDPNAWSLFVDADESIGIWNGTVNRNSAASRVTTGNWYLVACTKATGTVTPRFHIYNYTTPGWVHENGGGTLANSPAVTTGYLGTDQGGADVQEFIGSIQVCAYYKTALADLTLEGMVATRQSWVSQQPTCMWTLNQATTATAVRDEVDGAHQSALVGTTVVAGNPDWNDDLGADQPFTAIPLLIGH